MREGSHRPFIDYVESAARQNNDSTEVRTLSKLLAFYSSVPELTSSVAVVEILETMNKDIGQLAHCVDAFVNWWSGMATEYFSLQRVIPQIKPDGSNPIRSKDVRRRWLEIRDQYESYQNHVSYLSGTFEWL